MSEAIRFLHALAQAISASNLYSPGHPATAKSIEACISALRELLAAEPMPIFHFLGGAPIYQGRAIHELASWPWGTKLARAGIQRLEFDEDVETESLKGFLARIQQLMAEGPAESGVADVDLIPGIRFGTVAVVDTDELDGEAGGDLEGIEEEPSRELALDLSDELTAMQYVQEEAREGKLARGEAETIVRVLGSQLDRHELPQAAAPSDPIAYPQFHAINTALLTMAAASAAGVERIARHRLGVAALLHDIGMSLLPREFIQAESLTAEERLLMETHTAKGARLLLDQGGSFLDLAATVAFEHHLRPDGSGYPSRRQNSSVQWASRLVGTCAAYVALRAPRPFRASWSPSRALSHLNEGAGTIFDGDSARSLARLVSLTPPVR